MGDSQYSIPRGASANKAKAKYNAKAYDAFQVVLPKGQKDRISAVAKELGYKSRNEFITRAICEKLEREGFQCQM